jgi:uncharacterized protein YndB with AHSA1/START domain
LIAIATAKPTQSLIAGVLQAAGESRGGTRAALHNPARRLVDSRERRKENGVAQSGDVLEMPSLGMRIVFRQTSAETDGELLEYDVFGRPRGFVVQGHVHPNQEERQEVLAGATGLALADSKRVFGVGETLVVPRGTPHRHFPAGSGEGQVRVELRPALRTEEFLERLAGYDRDGQVTGSGWLRPVAAARMVLDFEREGRATRPPIGVQRALAGAILRVSAIGENSAREYVFVDEWDVRAPMEQVFDALADGRTYPAWWRPVYIAVEADGPPAVGSVSRQHFKGKLPYHLHTTSEIIEYDPPRRVVAEVEGDLRGRGVWTLTDRGDGATHVRFDWTVFADRKLLRTLTPVLRPAFRANHNWAIARAMEGLEPYARKTTPPPDGGPPR